MTTRIRRRAAEPISTIRAPRPINSRVLLTPVKASSTPDATVISEGSVASAAIEGEEAGEPAELTPVPGLTGIGELGPDGGSPEGVDCSWASVALDPPPAPVVD